MASSSPPARPPTEARLARKRHRQDARRRAILAAARQLLEVSGVDHFSVERTAELARLSKPSVYYYFKSKEAIILALSAEALEAETSALERVLESSAGTVIGRAVTAFVEHYAARAQSFKTLYFWSEVAGVARSLVETPMYPRAVSVREKLARALEAELGSLGPPARRKAESFVTLTLAAARGLIGDSFMRALSPKEVRSLAEELVRCLGAGLGAERRE
jgi:AcrR family transcriptional regulator